MAAHFANNSCIGRSARKLQSCRLRRSTARGILLGEQLSCSSGTRHRTTAVGGALRSYLLWGREQGNPNWLENEPLAEAADASSESTWEKERSASVVLPKTLFTQNDHVDAPVQLASIFSSIARDGMKLRVAGRGQPGSLEVILHDQQANQFSRPRSR
jgi:hypothetical protein